MTESFGGELSVILNHDQFNADNQIVLNPEPPN